MAEDANIIAMDIYVTDGNASLPTPDEKGRMTVYDGDGGTKAFGGPHALAAYLVTLQDTQKEVPIAVCKREGHIELEGIGKFMEDAESRDEGTLEIIGKVQGFRYMPREDFAALLEKPR